MLLAVTGSICAGKTTMCDMLSEMGADIVNLDALAKNILKRPEIKERVAGLGSVMDSREVDREKLADTVFSDKEKLGKLHKIVHPEIRKYLEGLDDIVADGAMIIEAGMQDVFDVIVLVKAPQIVRMSRCSRRETDFLRRDRAQMP